MERLSEVQRWDAVRSRRREASFFFAVRTTGIVCRPGCASRIPTRANVVFFDDLPSAMGAGFRPCKRCAPDDVSASAERERLVARACEMLGADQPPSLADVGAGLGLSRYHLARTFRRVTGLTPGEYLDARRQDRFRSELASGNSVTGAVQRAGYGSASRMYERRALGMTPTAFRRRGAGERVRFALVESPFGLVAVARAARGICAVEFARTEGDAVANVRSRFSAATVELEGSLAFVRAIRAAIAECEALASTALPPALHARLFCDRLRIALRDASE